MTTKHTPGPWQVDGESITTGEKCIAVIEDDGGYEAPSDQRKANARLIAASPDLLAACEAALSWLTNCNSSDPATVGRQLMAAMERAGYDKQTLDDAAVALVRGPCSVPTLYGEETT